MNASRFFVPLLLLVSPLATGLAANTAPNDKASTAIYRAETPDKVWDGWGNSSPRDPNADAKPAPAPENFDLVDQSAQAARTFSGKVVLPGATPMKGVQVGLVSLVGIHWIHEDMYQWEPVAADGSFSITDARYRDAAKALVVRGPNTPWTFLRANFAPGQGAKNIVLHADKPRKIRLTASGADMKNQTYVTFEPFHAYTQYDDQHHALRRQHLDFYKSGDANFVNAVMPAGEVAVFVRCPGLADYYVVINTEKASHIHFVMKVAGRMKITVLDADGKPKPKVHVSWVNEEAALSLWDKDTPASGMLAPNNLVPGTFQVSVAGFQSRTVKVEEGKVTELVFQEGKDDGSDTGTIRPVNAKDDKGPRKHIGDD